VHPRGPVTELHQVRRHLHLQQGHQLRPLAVVAAQLRQRLGDGVLLVRGLGLHHEDGQAVHKKDDIGPDAARAVVVSEFLGDVESVRGRVYRVEQGDVALASLRRNVHRAPAAQVLPGLQVALDGRRHLRDAPSQILGALRVHGAGVQPLDGLHERFMQQQPAVAVAERGGVVRRHVRPAGLAGVAHQRAMHGSAFAEDRWHDDSSTLCARRRGTLPYASRGRCRPLPGIPCAGTMPATPGTLPAPRRSAFSRPTTRSFRVLWPPFAVAGKHAQRALPETMTRRPLGATRFWTAPRFSSS